MSPCRKRATRNLSDQVYLVRGGQKISLFFVTPKVGPPYAPPIEWSAGAAAEETVHPVKVKPTVTIYGRVAISLYTSNFNAKHSIASFPLWSAWRVDQPPDQSLLYYLLLVFMIGTLTHRLREGNYIIITTTGSCCQFLQSACGASFFFFFKVNVVYMVRAEPCPCSTVDGSWMGET